MEFRLLGPLDVTASDGAVHVAGARRRGLLAYLLVHNGAQVSLDRIVEDLWDGRPSVGAAGTVRTYVSQLRKALPADCVIETLGGGYRLAVPPESVDADRFERLVAAATSSTDEVERLRWLDDALALWAGDPLGEFAGATWADVEATRLTGIRLRAAELRFETLLELGRHAEVLTELEQAAHANPLDERLWAQLMLAYYRSGKTADALRVFQELRTALVEQLGLEPGPELQQLERQILDHDPALAPNPGARTEEKPLSPAETDGRPTGRNRRFRRGILVAAAALVGAIVGLLIVGTSGDPRPTLGADTGTPPQLAQAKNFVARSTSAAFDVTYDAHFDNLPGFVDHGEQRDAVLFPDRGVRTVEKDGVLSETRFIGADYYTDEGAVPGSGRFLHAQLDQPQYGFTHTDWFPLFDRPQDLVSILDDAFDPVIESQSPSRVIMRVELRDPLTNPAAYRMFEHASARLIVDDSGRPLTITLHADGGQGQLHASIRFTAWNETFSIDTPSEESIDRGSPLIELKYLRVVRDDGTPIPGLVGGNISACPTGAVDSSGYCTRTVWGVVDPDTGRVPPFRVDPTQGYTFMALMSSDEWPCPGYKTPVNSDEIAAAGWQLARPTTFVVHKPSWFPRECGR